MTIFKDKFDSINCSALLGVDMEEPACRDLARSMGLFQSKCPGYAFFAAETLEKPGY